MEDPKQSDDDTIEFEIEVVTSSSSVSLALSSREEAAGVQAKELENLAATPTPASGGDPKSEGAEAEAKREDDAAERLAPPSSDERSEPVEQQPGSPATPVAVAGAECAPILAESIEKLPKDTREALEQGRAVGEEAGQASIPSEPAAAPTACVSDTKQDSGEQRPEQPCVEANKTVGQPEEGAASISGETIGPSAALLSDLKETESNLIEEPTIAAQPPTPSPPPPPIGVKEPERKLELQEQTEWASGDGQGAVGSGEDVSKTSEPSSASKVLEPISSQLISEPSDQCPGGWLLVGEADGLQIEPVKTSTGLMSTSEVEVVSVGAPQDSTAAAAAAIVAGDGDEVEAREKVANKELECASEAVLEQPTPTPIQLEPTADLAETAVGAETAQQAAAPDQQHVGRPSVELASGAPQVIIENESAGGQSQPPRLAPILIEPKEEDEANCLGPAGELEASRAEVEDELKAVDEDDDLEREFDEEPEFERRNVVVKRNRNPRDEYALSDELGRGRFGTVYRCSEMASGRQLAAKFITMRRREDREDVEREVTIMSVLQHKRLLQLYDAFDDGSQEMCLITELVEGGELFERIVDDDFDLTEKKAAIFMRQICEGVDYMHSQQIVHLDMKPENILCLSRTGNRIKLIDFGLARRLDPSNPIRVMFGTPDFAAPEVLGYETVTLATDMWSVGVICYVLLSGLSPFMGDNDMDTMANVTRATYDFNDEAFEPISDLAKDFIRKLLLRNPSERLKPGECLKHPWLQKGGAQLEAAVRERRESLSMLFLVQQNDPRRLSMEQAGAATAINMAEISPPYAFNRHRPSFGGESTASSGLISLDKRRLKRYVVKRKWHKTVHAIMALNRMGANLNKLTGL